jgi:ribose transport system ATP-binding protein
MPIPASSSAILEAIKITKQFPGVLALNGVDFHVYAGKVNAIVGENGAGKSTLMNILSGVYGEYEGTIRLDGKPVSFRNVSEAQQAGISMIHQELNLVPYMTVAENIFLGREPLDAAGLVDAKRMRKEASVLLERLHFEASPDTNIIDLRVGQQQMVEIAKALSRNAQVLIMDEPTSSLSENETNVLFSLIRKLKAEGVGIVYITHKMDELRLLADYVTILRDGCFITEARAGDLSIDDIVRSMVGRDTKDFFVKTDHDKGSVVLKVNHLSLEDENHPGKWLLKDISFQVSTSEVVGIYGLMGAGRTELLEALFGLHAKRTKADISVNGESVQFQHPKDAIDKGFALIPEDRKRDGLVLGMSMEQNTSLASLWNFLKHGLLNARMEKAQAEVYREKMSIKSYSCKQPAGQLSGGNQQKVVLSKWLLTQPAILLLDEPTRGIDINAKNDIYKLMDELAAQGMAIVVVSSELPEIMAVSDRILTLCMGEITGEFRRSEFKEELILKAALPAVSCET